MLILLDLSEKRFEICTGRRSAIIVKLTSKACYLFDDDINNKMAHYIEQSKME